MRYPIILAAVSGALVLAATPAAAKPGDKIAGQYICVFKAGAVARGNVRAEANRAASQGGGQLRHVYENSIRGFATNMSANGVAQLKRRNANIASCEQDQEVGIDSNPLEFREVGKPAPSATQSIPWGITRVGGIQTASTKRAWVIDSGIDLDHPDLVVNVGLSANFVTRESSPEDLNGHGTHVAGTIAARNNGFGVIGVAPGTEVVAVRVLDRRGSGANSGVIAGVDYVSGRAVAGDVANMSLSGGVSDATDNAVKAAAAKGIYFTLAAGNQAVDANTRSPARANGANIYTVASITESGAWSSFSNYGSAVDYAEPGSGVYSTYKNGGYSTLSGTSMAAPHLAGILLAGGVQAGGTVTRPAGGESYTIGIVKP